MKIIFISACHHIVFTFHWIRASSFTLFSSLNRFVLKLRDGRKSLKDLSTLWKCLFFLISFSPPTISKKKNEKNMLWVERTQGKTFSFIPDSSVFFWFKLDGVDNDDESNHVANKNVIRKVNETSENVLGLFKRHWSHKQNVWWKINTLWNKFLNFVF